jgi:signal transduction histidine kinase
MKKILVAVFVILFVVSVAFAAKSNKGTADEAKAMATKAVALIKSAGKAKAFAEFNNSKGAFIDRDLYIYVIDFKGVVLAHGANAKLIGKDLYDLKDADQKPFVKDIIAAAQAKGSGWSDYKWSNPTNKKVENKSSYFQKVDDVIVVCGIYK